MVVKVRAPDVGLHLRGDPSRSAQEQTMFNHPQSQQDEQ